VILIELEERGIGSIWDISQVPMRNFDWLSFIPHLVVFSGPSQALHKYDHV
jgi:hypothetical protein